MQIFISKFVLKKYVFNEAPISLPGLIFSTNR